ncbi:hypothetical protein [Pelotomaculum propionicicum]|uniref:Uncharacterized protein n=1 Tax=Pelotomaculum propionicicum TaxID=258475 RepID=A0A4Y7RLC0_9FIRM|nr:hypothetical protein [Pelotomaculum propionicicum]NLI13211.1 hypothetical protein [Peptococcaceae bacterium]TEB09539.1 hypothetical protein Pmgp_03034 [Pelotomaculum propionicicum]
MYPQTHVYFAEAILGYKSDPVSLGSVLPDMLIGEHFNHCEAHCKGVEIYNFLTKNHALQDFGQAVLTHGFTPEGLDYYGDEKYLDYEKGYSFEKARPFVQKTIEACRIPPEMGWWKAHNIIEMGVELIVGSAGHYNEQLKSAFTNHALVSEVSEMLQDLWKDKNLRFSGRVKTFTGFIELEKPGVESLAQKYKVQMQYKHKVEIDTKKVADLIYKAAEAVSTDLQHFFQNTSALVKDNLKSLTKP